MSENIQSIDSFQSIMDKRFGAGAVVDEDSSIDIERISTGSLTLDAALGGGWGVGKFIEVYAPESTGKTTLAIHSMVEAQKKYSKKATMIIDFEHAFDIIYARKIGLDTSKSRFKISQPNNAEEGMDILEEVIKSGLFSIVIIDSIAAMVPKSELEGESSDSSIGVIARLMSKSCRRFIGSAGKSGTTVLWINQLRDKIGVMFGNPETTTGGNAMKYYASQRVDLRKDIRDAAKNGKIKVKATVKKNKLSAPFLSCEYYIGFGEGILKTDEILDLSVELGIINQKGGGNYELIDGEEITKLGRGRESVLELLKDNKELTERLEIIIRENIK